MLAVAAVRPVFRNGARAVLPDLLVPWERREREDSSCRKGEEEL